MAFKSVLYFFFSKPRKNMVNQENTRDQKKFEIIISVFPSLYFCCLLQISTNFSIYFRKNSAWWRSLLTFSFTQHQVLHSEENNIMQPAEPKIVLTAIKKNLWSQEENRTKGSHPKIKERKISLIPRKRPLWKRKRACWNSDTLVRHSSFLCTSNEMW